MNHIQGQMTVGAPATFVRAKAAIENGLLICSPCLDAMQSPPVVAPFTTERVTVSGGDKVQCYICEREMRFNPFRVSLPAPAPAAPPVTDPNRAEFLLRAIMSKFYMDNAGDEKFIEWGRREGSGTGLMPEIEAELAKYLPPHGQ